MTDIPNTEYITINKDGVFVGGKPATTYHRIQIKNIDEIKVHFADIQKKCPEIEELHVGAFETRGKYKKPGTPSGNFGPNAWVRAKLFDGRVGPWVFNGTHSSASGCARYCASHCGYNVRYNSDMRFSGLLKFAQTAEEYETIRVIEDGIYRITIEKLIQNQK